MSEHDFGFRSEFYTFAPETLQKEFPDFKILREVGKGSMGIVYEAERRSDGARVALKVLPPSLTLTDRALARFQKEGEVMARIEHDTIVKVHEHGRQGRLHFFCMEFVDGVSLQERLSVGPLPLRTAAEFGLRVAKALQFAHDRGVLHRDVKPANLMLGNDGRVMITDFGLARETGTGSLTESGAIVGTPMYMAPEQIVGDKGAVDARADVYGLGATLYELVTGHPPFSGPTAQSVLKDVLEKEPRRPSKLRKDIPEPLEAIILHAIEKQPGRRYGSAQEMAEDLQRYLSGDRVQASLPSLVTRVTRAALARPLLSILVLIILALAVVAAGLFHDRQLRGLQDQLREVELDFNRATSLDMISVQPLTADERSTMLARAKDRASSIIREAPGKTETALPAYLWRARIHNWLKEYEQALQDLDQADRLLGREPRKDVLTYRIDTLQKLPGEVNRKRLQQDLTALLKLDPGRDTQLLVVDHLLLMAEALVGDRKEILDRVEKILTKTDEPGAPQTPRLAVAKARLLELQDKLPEANAAISLVTETYPTDPLGYIHAARIYRRLGKEQAAANAESMARALRGDRGEETAAQPPTSKPSVDLTQMLEFLRRVEKLTGDDGPATKGKGKGRREEPDKD